MLSFSLRRLSVPRLRWLCSHLIRAHELHHPVNLYVTQMEQVVVQVWPRATNRSRAPSYPAWVSTHFPSPKLEEDKTTRWGGNLEGRHCLVQFLEVTKSVTQFGNPQRNKNQNTENGRGLSGCVVSTDEPVTPTFAVQACLRAVLVALHTQCGVTHRPEQKPL